MVSAPEGAWARWRTDFASAMCNRTSPVTEGAAPPHRSPANSMSYNLSASLKVRHFLSTHCRHRVECGHASGIDRC